MGRMRRRGNHPRINQLHFAFGDFDDPEAQNACAWINPDNSHRLSIGYLIWQFSCNVYIRVNIDHIIDVIEQIE